MLLQPKKSNHRIFYIFIKKYFDNFSNTIQQSIIRKSLTANVQNTYTILAITLTNNEIERILYLLSLPLI